MIFLEASDYNEPGCMFSGIAFSENSVVRTKVGFKEYIDRGKDPFEFVGGKYCFSYWIDGSSKVIQADPSGQELLFYYTHGDFWAVSNSFYILVSYLKQRGLKVSLDYEALALVLVNGVAFDQPISDLLPVKNVKLLPESKKIVISENKISIADATRNDGAFSSVGFEGAVAKFVGFYRSLFKQFVCEGLPVNLELSGGLDSRVLAAITSDLAESNNFGYISQKSKPEDYIVASELVRLLGKSELSPVVGSTVERINPSISSRWQAFVAANVGVSQTTRILPGAETIRPSLRINGGGGELAKSVYGSSLSPYLATVNKSLLTDYFKEKVKERFLKEVREISDKDVDSLTAMYRKYRYRYFVGKGWYWDFMLCSITPFSSKLYQNVVDSDDVELFFGRDKDYVMQNNLIYLYLILKCRSSLAFVVSDKKVKNFSVEDILLVDRLPEIKPVEYPSFSIYGNMLSGIDFLDQEFLAGFPLSTLIGDYTFASLSEAFYAKVEKSWASVKAANLINADAVDRIESMLAAKSLDDKTLASLFHVAMLVDLAA